MTTSKSNWFDLKLLCPLLIAAACLWDAGMRFFPERIQTFRAWESALPMATAEGDFRPLLVYDNPQAFGDLSNLANCESCRVSRRERFTTDTRGFRNPPGDSNPYTMVLTGDSFGVGSSLSDEDTLSRQLDRILPGQHVYNASAQKPQWGYALKIIEAQGIRNSFLIWEHAQLHPFPTGPIDPPLSTQRRLAQKLGGGKEPTWYPAASGALKWARAWFTFSPLKMTVQRGLRHAELHGILPSGSPSQVSRVTLTNGQPMLSYDAELEAIRNPSKPDLAFFRSLRAAVRETGNELLVVLMPSKYSVYGPLMRNPPLAIPASPLADAESALRSAQIPVLDLTPALRRGAASALKAGQLIYHADDTHWNPAGVGEGSREIAKFLKDLGLSLQSKPEQKN